VQLCRAETAEDEDCIVNRSISFALLAGGIVLIILGVNASNALSSDISRFFTGSPTDRSIWMLVAGVMASVVGLMGLTRFLKRKQD
jgi:hypothetical protein